jgi:hypothetical protein
VYRLITLAFKSCRLKTSEFVLICRKNETSSGVGGNDSCLYSTRLTPSFWSSLITVSGMAIVRHRYIPCVRVVEWKSVPSDSENTHILIACPTR